MGEFRKSILSICLGVLALNALVLRDVLAYVAGELEVDNGYLGMATKTIPKSVLAVQMRIGQNLLKEKPGENAVYSATSAYSALMMVHLAAGDKTREELDKVFKMTDKEVDHEKLHETFSAILKKFQHASSGPDDQLPETFIANGFFVQKGRTILDSFTESLKKYYGTNTTTVDFLEHASEATDLINAWISESTHKRIDKFYTSPVSSTTVSILANALYFNGVWKDTFSKEQTKTEKFNTGTSEIEVQMMQNQKVVPYCQYSHNDFHIDSIELPYRGGEHVMVITMPGGNKTLENFIQNNHKFDIREYNRHTKMVAVDYKIPKLKISWKNSLLNALGLEEIFRNADLSRMSTEKIPVSDIFQATDLEMDEQGTIASAATIVSNTRLLTPPVTAEKQFYVNRPYILTIVHKPTLMIPFQAVIYKPQY